MSESEFHEYHCKVIRDNIKLLNIRLAELAATKEFTAEYIDTFATRNENVKCLQKLKAEMTA